MSNNGIRPRRRAAGMTVMEYVITIGISGIVITVLISLMVYGGYTFAGLANYAELNTASLRALDQMTSDIRQATRLVDHAPNYVVFNDGVGNPDLTYFYSPDQRTLMRIQGTRREVLLTECDNLRFSIFQRTPFPGTYDQHPVATPDTAKSVVVSWVCSRKILGKRWNTESVHTAKIVIRKE